MTDKLDKKSGVKRQMFQYIASESEARDEIRKIEEEIIDCKASLRVKGRQIKYLKKKWGLN